jgi:arylsulfatase A-like enzyme
MLRSLLLLTLLGSALPAHAADKPAPPNIVFIFTDDHASHAISAYGSKINKTPNIDRLAKEGMLFRNCFCTNSICAPSRAVILTGKHSHLNGVIDNRLAFDGSQQNVGKLLGKAGYQTAMIGKWHLKSDPTGFDRWAVLSGAGGQGTYYNPEFKTDKGVIKPTGYVTEITTDLAVEWLDGRDKSKPFLLMYQHKAPHRQWEPGPKQLGLYRDGPIPEPDTLFDDHAGLASPAKKQEMTVEKHLTQSDLKLVPPNNLTPEQLKVWNAAYEAENKAFRDAKLEGKELVRWKYQRYIKDYLRCVAGVDDQIGRLLQYLDDNGLSKNTIVMYSSDQGFYLGDRGWYDKRWMYEESLRMPFLVRWPGVVKAGSENKDLAQNLDFAQTFLDAAGVSAPADMQGRSLVPLLKGKTPDDWRKSIYYHYFEYPGPHSVQKHYGVRTQTHKLIHYYPINEWELFDLEKDPGERKNLYGQKEYDAITKTLKEELTRLRKLYKVDTFKEPELPKAKEKGKNKKPKDGLVLHFTLASKVDPLVDVASGLKGKHHKVHIVNDDARLALKFGGEGHVTLASNSAIDPSESPLTVGAWVSADSPKGVLMAQGGESQGWSLHLEESVPIFSVRSDGKLTQAKAERSLPRGKWAHVVAVLDRDGKLQVSVDGKAGDRVQGSFIATTPADGFSLGADTGSFVGDYRDSRPFTGLLGDIRVYRGLVPEKEMTKWAEPRK